SRKRMAQVISVVKGNERQRFQAAYETVMDYFRRGKDEMLKSLSLDTIEQLIRAGKPLPQARTEENNGKPEKPTTNSTAQRPLRGRQLDKIIGQMVASGDKKDRKELKQLAADLRDVYSEEDGSADGNIAIGDNVVDTDLRDETRAILDAISHFCNADAWGG